MAPQIRKAQRKRAKFRGALFGPAGSGKTKSSILLAMGLGDKIGFIDTENGSGELYSDICDYDIIGLEAPYTVAKYREAIGAFEQAGYDVIIIDSLTHAWAGDGGLLDKQGGLVSSGKYKSGFDAWREVTPDYNKLVEELLNSPAHIIGTMRSKVEWVVEENDRGKKVPRKIGLAPIQREGLEYEFTVCFEISADNHYARATKDRTSMFDGWADLISAETGRKLRDWLESGAEPPPPPPPGSITAPPPDKATAVALDLYEAFTHIASIEEYNALVLNEKTIAQRAWLGERRPELSKQVENAAKAALTRVDPQAAEDAPAETS